MRLKHKLIGLAWLVFLLYLAVLLKLILFKYHSGLMVQEITIDRLLFRLQYAANFVPTRTIAYYLSGDVAARVALENIVGNIVIFSPLGFLVPLIFPRLSGVRHIAAIAFGTSLFLELVQLLTGLGEFDVDDLLLNVLGSILGVLAVQGVRKVIATTVK